MGHGLENFCQSRIEEAFGHIGATIWSTGGDFDIHHSIPSGRFGGEEVVPSWAMLIVDIFHAVQYMRYSRHVRAYSSVPSKVGLYRKEIGRWFPLCLTGSSRVPWTFWDRLRRVDHERAKDCERYIESWWNSWIRTTENVQIEAYLRALGEGEETRVWRAHSLFLCPSWLSKTTLPKWKPINDCYEARPCKCDSYHFFARPGPARRPHSTILKCLSLDNFRLQNVEFWVEDRESKNQLSLLTKCYRPTSRTI